VSVSLFFLIGALSRVALRLIGEISIGQELFRYCCQYIISPDFMDIARIHVKSISLWQGRQKQGANEEANCVKPSERAKRWCATRRQGGKKGEMRGRKWQRASYYSARRGSVSICLPGTIVLPHKPILCRGLCGGGACVAVAVAMDHPSRGFRFPSQVDNIHADTVPYGWGVRQTIQKYTRAFT
jgi:hypothetical protein